MERHQLRSVGYSNVEAVLEDGTVKLMLCLHIQAYLDQQGKPTQTVELPPLVMTPEALQALCEGLLMQLQILKSEGPARTAAQPDQSAH